MSETPAGRKRILIVSDLDGYANGKKPVEIERFLRSRGHDVQMANALYLGRASSKPDSVLRMLPHPSPRKLALYLVQVASRLFTRGWKFGRRRFSYYLLRAELRLSAAPRDGLCLSTTST